MAALLAGWLACHPGEARAYTISAAVTAGCHESITTEALRAVRLELETAAPLPATRDERALIKDLEFVPASDMNDLGGASLLIGVRDNDLKGRDSGDVTQLALVHGDPAAQKEHCLRSTHEAEPGGTQKAILDCHAFILERVGQALEGLDADGNPDAAKRTSLPLYLSLRHHVDAPLPTFYVRIGQAIHAIEDSFTHTYRTPDSMRITVALDWVDAANRELVEATDGPAHSQELDRCDDPDPSRQRRRELATEAATAVLRATLDPTQTSTQKMAAMEVLLEKYLGYSPGCTFENQWCSAPEHALDHASSGCSVAGRASAASRWGWLTGAALLALAKRRRRLRGRAAILAGSAVLFAALSPARAFAQSEAGGAAGEQQRPTESTIAGAPTPPPQPGPPNQNQTAFGAYLGGSGSVTHEAAAATLGARVRVTKHWVFGVDAEWNPWIAVNGQKTVRAGAFNLYGTAIFRLPTKYEKFNLRVTGNLGASRLLIDLYGAPKGSTGVYAGLSPLGLEWKWSRMFYLIVNPLNIAVPVPQMSGVPFSYPQYRATIGLELYAG